MKFFANMQRSALIVFIYAICFGTHPIVAFAASDNARVISSPIQKSTTKGGEAKSTVIALINLEEVMPDCQQQVARAKIKSIQYSESGITTESITFTWSKSTLTIPTLMGDNSVLSLDDLIDASKFIKTGNTYFIHFQVCQGRQERSLINIYAI